MILILYSSISVPQICVKLNVLSLSYSKVLIIIHYLDENVPH